MPVWIEWSIRGWKDINTRFWTPTWVYENYFENTEHLAASRLLGSSDMLGFLLQLRQELDLECHTSSLTKATAELVNQSIAEIHLLQSQSFSDRISMIKTKTSLEGFIKDHTCRCIRLELNRFSYDSKYILCSSANPRNHSPSAWLPSIDNWVDSPELTAHSFGGF